ncbi:tRNA pseudouridine synthase B [Buchnera aphidicola (Eriosoma lanigerum)]|uniref:tRNA pseudouridine(55) synthase TruB n=1 Tax=Buchnera aphidicola TaxID=9 RepID=UPI003463D4AF
MKFRYHINGVLLIDKPKGISSAQVVKQVKNIFQVSKVGHTGALDPLATGILPICFGESTKFSNYLLNSNKRYLVIAKLGIKTDTSDAEGKIIKERKINFTNYQLQLILKKFIGNIDQQPSMYSAIKYRGIPLYKYAREGITINRETRKIIIYELNYIIHNKKFIKLEIYCSKGTYIRTLIDDLGEELGCGAHVVFLRRIQVGFYNLTNLVNLEKLNNLKIYYHENNLIYSKYIKKLLYPIDSPISHLSKINLNEDESKKIIQGQAIKLSRIYIFPRKTVRIINIHTKLFIGIGKINQDNFLIPIRLISICL